MAIEGNDQPDGGPAIDVHHHLWDLSMGRHPWLAPTGGLTAIGDLGYLRHDYGLEDIARDTAGSNVVATVHVEALWDPTRAPTEETAWLDSLPLRDGSSPSARRGDPADHPLAPGPGVTLDRGQAGGEPGVAPWRGPAPAA